MTEDLGRRVYHEYCWFAAVLLVVLVGALDRIGLDGGRDALPAAPSANTTKLPPK